MLNLRALAPVCIGWTLFCAPAMAGSFGLSLSGSGGSGDACVAGTPQSAAEGFSYSDSGTNPLTDMGSDVGYNNGSGCQNSAVYGTSSAAGTAAYGVLTATANASMAQYLVESGGSDTSGWNDTITAVSGGNYLITVESINTVNGVPSCPMVDGSGNSTATSQTGFSASNPIGGTFAIADWQTSDCTPTSAPTYIYGSGNKINNQTVQFTDGLAPGGYFTLGASIMAGTGIEGDVTPGNDYPATASASANLIVTVTGLNGATYISASGNVYDASSTPEPASWLLAAAGFVAMALRIRGKNLVQLFH
jgi:hypothetical protein